jgi:hypothetical protein
MPGMGVFIADITKAGNQVFHMRHLVRRPVTPKKVFQKHHAVKLPIPTG